MTDFKILGHTADLRIRVYGKTIKELFRNALKGMFKSIAPDWLGGKEARRTVTIQSADLNTLLVDFLSEALTLSDINDEAYSDAKFVKLTGTALKAELRGMKIKRLETEIKAVTHHELDIKKIGGHWETAIVFDI